MGQLFSVKQAAIDLECGPHSQPSPEELDAFMHLSREEIGRLVLWLLVEEGLKDQLAFFRSQDLPTEPVQG